MIEPPKLPIEDEMLYAVNCPVSGVTGHVSKLLSDGAGTIRRLRKHLEDAETAYALERKLFNSRDDEVARQRESIKELLDELREVVVWAVREKAPLRQQEIESIQAVIANNRLPTKEEVPK